MALTRFNDIQIGQTTAAAQNIKAAAVDCSTPGGMRWVRAVCLAQDQTTPTNITATEIACMVLPGAGPVIIGVTVVIAAQQTGGLPAGAFSFVFTGTQLQVQFSNVNAVNCTLQVTMYASQ
jgi:hypothetical protein